MSGSLTHTLTLSLTLSLTHTQHEELLADERLKNIEEKMVEMIMNEILDHSPGVRSRTAPTALTTTSLLSCVCCR